MEQTTVIMQTYLGDDAPVTGIAVVTVDRSDGNLLMWMAPVVDI
jgi:hypothetical protein